MHEQQLASMRFISLSDWHITVYSLLLSGVLTMGGCIKYLGDLSNSVAYFGLHPLYLAVVWLSLFSVRDTLQQGALTKPSLAATLSSFICGLLACGSAAAFVGFTIKEIFVGSKHLVWTDNNVVPVIVYIALGALMALCSLAYCIVVLSFNNDEIVSRYSSSSKKAS